jgi:hypothetical protein
VNVVDSSGWIEFALDGPNAGIFEPPLPDTANLVVPSISVFEVYRYSVARVHEATLWTQDPDLRGLDGVKYVDAHGSR